MSRLWDKGTPLDERGLAYTAGDDYQLDERLVEYDVRASIAHAEMLGEQGLLSAADLAAIRGALTDIGAEHALGRWRISLDQEDCQTAIENLLTASPLLSEVVVIGKLDSEGGEYPHAIIYPDPDIVVAKAREKGSALGDEELRALVRAEIHKCTAGAAVYKIPHSFEVSKEELPKTSTRKVKRFMFAEASRSSGGS